MMGQTDGQMYNDYCNRCDQHNIRGAVTTEGYQEIICDLSNGTKLTHTHTQPFNDFFPGQPVARRRVGGNGITWTMFKLSAPRSRQITIRATHHSSFLQAGCSSCHPTNSVKALKANFQTDSILETPNYRSHPIYQHFASPFLSSERGKERHFRYDIQVHRSKSHAKG